MTTDEINQLTNAVREARYLQHSILFSEEQLKFLRSFNKDCTIEPRYEEPRVRSILALPGAIESLRAIVLANRAVAEGKLAQLPFPTKQEVIAQ